MAVKTVNSDNALEKVEMISDSKLRLACLLNGGIGSKCELFYTECC